MRIDALFVQGADPTVATPAIPIPQATTQVLLLLATFYFVQHHRFGKHSSSFEVVLDVSAVIEE
jgi:hypothetical protein